MKAIYEYVKSKGKDNIVVANPGRQITDKLAPYADVFVTSEIRADEYINRFTEPESEFENNEDNFYHLHPLHQRKIRLDYFFHTIHNIYQYLPTLLLMDVSDNLFLYMQYF